MNETNKKPVKKEPKEPTSRDLQREKTKQVIYDTALKLFTEHNYDEVKMTDIAKASGVAVGSIYYHFRNKEAIVDFGYERFDEALQKEYDEVNPKPGRKGIDTLMRYHVAFVSSLDYRIVGISYKSHIGAENTFYLSKRRFLYRCLRKNLMAAGIKEENADEVTDTFLRSIRGCIFDWRCYQGRYNLSDIFLEDLNILYHYYNI